MKRNEKKGTDKLKKGLANKYSPKLLQRKLDINK